MAEDTRTRILEAARELVATRGFHGTSMSRIATRVGISSATIYHHFSSKDQLYHELYRILKSDAVQAAAAGMNNNTELLREKLFRLNRQYVTHMLHHPQDASYIAQYERSTYYAEAPHIETREALTELVEEAIRQGIYRQPIALLRAFSTGVAGLIAELHAVGELEITEDIVHQTVEATWSAMKR